MAVTVEIGGIEVSHSGPGPYVARSASDRDPNWPFWYVADAVGFNGLDIRGSLVVLMQKEVAALLADRFNQEKSQ